MNALFNVYKPAGPTSHDVVARLRRAAKIKRVGHAGTLDPLAEGVLIVAIGQATRVIEYLADQDKAYRASITLGVETDTYDAEGRVVAQRPVDGVTREAVEAALGTFRGAIDQRPPAYSAISVGGRRLYDLARAGQAVQAPLRRVEITRLELEAWDPPRLSVLVECSKGTYIRSLAHDLGQALGCGAHLSGLIRLRVGPFVAHNAVPLAELEEKLRDGQWPAVALAPDAALAAFPAVRLDRAAARTLANGVAVPDPGGSGGSTGGSGNSAAGLTSGTLGRAYGPDGELIAVVRYEASAGTYRWRPEKVFAPDPRS